MDECGLECFPRGGSGVVTRGGSGGQAGTRNLAGEANGGASAGDGGAAASGEDCPEDTYAVVDMPCSTSGKVCRYYECNFEVATLTCDNGLWDLEEVQDGGCEDDSACPYDLIEGAGTYCSEDGKICVDWESDVCEFGVFVRCVDSTWTLPSDYLADGECLRECPSNLAGDGGFAAYGQPCAVEGKRCDDCYVTPASDIIVCEGGVWVSATDTLSCPIGAGGAGGSSGAGGASG